MPGVYKEKQCPTCKKSHRKRGEYCCARCAQLFTVKSNTVKEKISEGLREFYLTPEGIASAAVNNRRVNALRMNEAPPVTIDEFTVDIPTIYDIPDGYTSDF
jgi:uncharacterized Zn finger protein (UPF0148 family)